MPGGFYCVELRPKEAIPGKEVDFRVRLILSTKRKKGAIIMTSPELKQICAENPKIARKISAGGFIDFGAIIVRKRTVLGWPKSILTLHYSQDTLREFVGKGISSLIHLSIVKWLKQRPAYRGISFYNSQSFMNEKTPKEAFEKGAKRLLDARQKFPANPKYVTSGYHLKKWPARATGKRRIKPLLRR